MNGDQHPFFGEGALLDSDARSATIRAEDECHCLVLSREHFDQIGIQHPDWCLPVMRRISRVVMGRFKKANHDLLMLYHALVSEIRGG